MSTWTYQRHDNQIWVKKGNSTEEYATVLGENISPEGDRQLWLDRRLHIQDGDGGEGFEMFGAVTTILVIGASSGDQLRK